MTKKIWDLYAINSAKIFSQCRPMLVGTGGLTLFPGTPLLEESERGNDPQGRGYGSVFGDIGGKR